VRLHTGSKERRITFRKFNNLVRSSMTTTVQKCPACGADAINRSEYWEAYPENGAELSRQLHLIRKEIKKYYLALDNRQHGGVAENKAFNEIQQILGMNWVKGEVKGFLEQHPKLKPHYT
jgi:hypothetical protein